MTSASSLFRSLVIYGVCLPLAVFLGYLLANPFDLQTFTVLGLVLLLLMIPLLLRWHHTWLIFTWNSTIVLFFLPGAPGAWTVLAWAGLLIASLQYILDRRAKFLSAPSVTRPLLFLAVVVLVTAHANGGMGMRIFGGDTYGGKRYLMILSGIAGYFALTSQRIPPMRALFFVGLYFFGAVTLAMGELAPVLGPVFKPLLMFFPQSNPYAGRPGAVASPHAGMSRVIFLAPAGAALINILMARYGIRGIFAWNHLGRLLGFLGCVLVAMLGGYRSTMIMILLTFALVFYLEGLMRSRLLPVFILSVILATTILTPFVSYLPNSLQRSLSFLPVPVDEEVKQSARGSTEWRVQMWRRVLPQVPEHLLLGKGYTFSVNEMQMAWGDMRSGNETEGFEVASDFHNGPLSIVLPFGIWGVLAFLWFAAAGARVLYRNYLYGDPAFRQFNRVLLAYYLAVLISFLFVVGGLYSDFFLFAGAVGFSISLNGGVAQPAAGPVLKVAPRRMGPPRAIYRPAGA